MGIIDLEPINIEYAAFDSWPALEQFEKNGIIYRYSNGYTKRANSANVMKLSNNESFKQRVTETEFFYSTKCLPTIFRIPSFIDQDQTFDLYLGQQGYSLVEPSIVMACSLDDENVSVEYSNMNELDIYELDINSWLISFYGVSGNDMDNLPLHQDIIQRIKKQKALFSLYLDQQYIACGLGVISCKLLGLYDVATHIGWRRKGHASQVIRGLLSWGKSQGANMSYIQVVEANQSAVKLYQSLGYRKIYTYKYRVKSFNQGI